MSAVFNEPREVRPTDRTLSVEEAEMLEALDDVLKRVNEIIAADSPANAAHAATKLRELSQTIRVR